jgi:enterochelin esterase family protein
MPLHEIIKPGETWQPASADIPQPTKPPEVKRDGLPLKEPTCAAVALGGSTLLVADAADRYIWALQIQKDGSIGPGDRYCRLRVRGDDRRKRFTPEEAYRAEPTAMTIDGANRTYVATNLGIQVFDPTGRLCGVFTAPLGHITELAFDRDRLFAGVGDKVFVRKMLATGTK